MKFCSRIAALLVFLLAAAGRLDAQQTPATTPAQPGGIQGRVVSEAGAAVAGAVVTARAEGDTAVAARGQTGADGRFRLAVPPGRYQVRARHEGAEATSAPVAVAAGADAASVGDLRVTGTVVLEGVVARAERPPVIHAEDRTVYSVKDMPSVTGGAADVMRTVPELEVDLDGNVTMVGQRTVTIHINGRPSPLRAEALTEFIKNLPADRIDRIEVIPNPSVRFEGGNTAIVNIVLRKDVRLGLSGSVSANAATRGGNGLSGQLAYQMGKLTLFGGGSGNIWSFSDEGRELRENRFATPITFLDQERRNEGNSSFGSVDLTAELDVGPRETVWASGNFYAGGQDNDAWSRNRLLDAVQSPTRVFDRVSVGDGGYAAGDAAVGFRRIVEAQKHEMSLELRHNWNGYDNESRHEENTSLLAEGEEAVDELRVTDGEMDERTLTAKADYMRPFGTGGRVEVGLRTQMKSTDELNLLEVYALPTPADPRERTEYEFGWREDEHSAYVNLSQRIGKLSLQGGLRAEASNVGLSSGGEDLVDLDYFSVFPSANVAMNLGEGRDVRLSYSRRVRRPWIWALNPFIPQTDPLNVRLGNPDLEPTTTESFGLDASARVRTVTLRLSPYYRRTTDELEYIRTVDAAGVATTRPENLATVTQYGSTLNASIRPGPWGTISATVGASRLERDAGEALADIYSGTSDNRFFSANTSLQPGSGWGVQASMRISSPRETSQGRFSSTMWSEVGVRKSFLNDRASVNLRVTDPLGVFETRFESRDPSFSGTGRNTSSWGSRSASVSFTWRFGTTPRRRSTPNEAGAAPGVPTGGGPP